MLDENEFGIRDARGQWTPHEKPAINPFFSSGLTWQKAWSWLRGYFWPWNLLFAILGVLSLAILHPLKPALASPDLFIFLMIYAKNGMIILIIYGLLEWRLYLRQKQEIRFKYNGKFPGGRKSAKFLFQSQYLDNLFWTFASGIPIWSGYEMVILTCWANDIGLWTGLAENPAALFLLFLMVPLIHELHFYLIHRLLHFPVFYKYVHSVHHRAVNPSPLSSLSMHPVEHLLYWSDCLIHLLVPSHPLIALYHLQLTGTGAVVGHVGFDRIEIGSHQSIKTHAFAHYLHHKYFNVNFGDGAVPFDRLFGSWHDGSEQANQLMRQKMAGKNG